MIEPQDIISYLRDLLYVEEQALNVLQDIDTDEHNNNILKKVRDRIIQKQIIVARIVSLYREELGMTSPHETLGNN